MHFPSGAGSLAQCPTNLRWLQMKTAGFGVAGLPMDMLVVGGAQNAAVAESMARVRESCILEDEFD